jgi:TonB family protein
MRRRGLKRARSFIRLPLKDGDTSTVRTSLRLRSDYGDGMYVARRQRDGHWTEERFVVLETAGAREPLIVNGDDKSVGEILDSLESVVRRTPIVPARPKSTVDATAYTEATVEKPASALPDNRPPIYPLIEREGLKDGTVILKFVIGLDGRAEMGTVRVVFATADPFLRSVMEALPKMRFHPAEISGKPVRQQVQMPFAFSIVR